MQEKRIDGSYGLPEVFDQSKMMKKLLNPKVESVNVFRGTSSNITLAEYRSRFPKLTRKQLKSRIKSDRKYKNPVKTSS